MRKNLFFPIAVVFAGTLLAGAACSFKLNVPAGQVLCKADTDCPSGAVCETINQDAAPIIVRVCCLKPGCTANLPSDTVSAAIAAAYQPPQDGSAEAGVSVDAPNDGGTTD
ncbi:MAG: hypothetical protein WCG85_14985 [Polyangia bacterium]